MEHRLGAICSLHSFNRRAGILSGRQAFVVSSSLKRSFTSSTDTSICEISISVVEELIVYSLLLRPKVAGRKTEQKYLLKLSAFPTGVSATSWLYEMAELAPDRPPRNAVYDNSRNA